MERMHSFCVCRHPPSKFFRLLPTRKITKSFSMSVPRKVKSDENLKYSAILLDIHLFQLHISNPEKNITVKKWKMDRYLDLCTKILETSNLLFYCHALCF